MDNFFLNSIISNIPHFVFWKDINLIYCGCNRNFAAISGFSDPSEIIGKTDYDLPWEKLGIEIYRKEDIEVLSGKTILDKEVPLIDIKGENRIISICKTPWKNANNKIIGIVGIYTDITERKKSENELIDAKEKALQANRAKTEFLVDAVKELNRAFEIIKKSTNTLASTHKETNLAFSNITNTLNDMENFAKFDLLDRNLFSEELGNNNIKSYLKHYTIEKIKYFQEYYKKFRLTERESECLYYHVRGMTTKYIAKKLNLSYRTVEFYLNNSKTKLGCRTKQELIGKVFENGVV